MSLALTHYMSTNDFGFSCTNYILVVRAHNLIFSVLGFALFETADSWVIYQNTLGNLRDCKVIVNDQTFTELFTPKKPTGEKLEEDQLHAAALHISTPAWSP
jgi:hypothetical protein